MDTRLAGRKLILGLFLFFSMVAAAQDDHVRFHITFTSKVVKEPMSGRLILYMSQKKPNGRGVLTPGDGEAVKQVWIAARDVDSVKAGDILDIDPDQIEHFPSDFAKAPAGDYYVMAALDVDRNAAYKPWTPGDIGTVAVEEKALNPAHAPAIALTVSEAVGKPNTPLPNNVELATFVSPLLSKFYGHPVTMQAAIVLPPGYHDSTQKYPAVYVNHGYTATLQSLIYGYGQSIENNMQTKRDPEMIHVVLLQEWATGTHEFANSVNTGPWFDALIKEFIPYLEAKYRMDATPRGRLLTGHSSGGWATVWLMINAPKFFGGAWATSPDPVDFRSFTGPNLVKTPPDNFYRKADGTPWWLVREDGKNTETIEDFARQERVLGHFGGQMASFEAVFSPRGGDGRPMPLFNRETGEVDPAVAKAWQKFNVSEILAAHWKELAPDLKGKLRIYVGTEDTFHLDEPVHLLEERMKEIHADVKFTYVEGASHFTLFAKGLDHQIEKEMYEVARPAAKAKPATRKRTGN